MENTINNGYETETNNIVILKTDVLTGKEYPIEQLDYLYNKDELVNIPDYLDVDFVLSKNLDDSYIQVEILCGEYRRKQYMKKSLYEQNKDRFVDVEGKPVLNHWFVNNYIKDYFTGKYIHITEDNAPVKDFDSNIVGYTAYTGSDYNTDEIGYELEGNCYVPKYVLDIFSQKYIDINHEYYYYVYYYGELCGITTSEEEEGTSPSGVQFYRDFDDNYYDSESDIGCAAMNEEHWECADDREYPIYPYHSRRNYIPCTVSGEEDTTYYGFEIETEGGKENSQLIENLYSDCFHCEHDGSLNDGYEIISEPMTWNFLKSYYATIKDMLDEQYDNGQNADDEKTCGLHIHVSRSAFKDENAIKRAVAIVAGFKDNMEILGRRSENSYCSYLKVDDKLNIKKKKIMLSEDRYQAVNTTKPATIEFRFFQSTLKADILYASIELCKNIVEVANSDVKIIKFKDLLNGEYVGTYTVQFKNLTDTEIEYNDED